MKDKDALHEGLRQVVQTIPNDLDVNGIHVTVRHHLGALVDAMNKRYEYLVGESGDLLRALHQTVWKQKNWSMKRKV